MSIFLENFKNVIRKCDYSNTYKMAWAKGIVELSGKNMNNDTEYVNIPIIDIAERMIKYYWDQTIYFNLFQSAPNQPPVILQLVKELICNYQELKNNYSPIVFERVKEFKNELKKTYDSILRKCVTAIKANVLYRFPILAKETFDFYTINSSSITFRKKDISELFDNQQDLFEIINYRWSLMLEDYNSSPRIGKKVRIMDEQKIERGSLSVFDKYLDLENKDHICFICGKKIEDNQLSRDHVIPWSYVYSDDLWNLVYVHKSCNSTKSNIIPKDEDIIRLKERNAQLVQAMKNRFGNENKKIYQDLNYAVENDYVDKFYLGCKGC